VVSFTPRPLYLQGKSPCYPLDRRLGGPQGRSGRGGEEKNSQPPPGIEPYNPDRPVRSPALYRLSYHGSEVLKYNKTMEEVRGTNENCRLHILRTRTKADTFSIYDSAKEEI
jgi:hypothetical protein